MNLNLKNIEKNLGFNNRTLAQISLPHSNINTNYYERTNGLFTLSVFANPKDGLPYGTYPRLLLAWICTQAVKTQSKEIYLGANQKDFCQKLQLNVEGGSSIAQLKEQSEKLFKAIFRAEYNNTKENFSAWKNLVLADTAFQFWQPQKGEWEAHIKLTEEFFNDLISNPVPIDMNVLNALRKSPMAIDAYVWASYRAYSIYTSGGRPVKIKWDDLQAQFGAGYGEFTDKSEKQTQEALRNFKKRFLVALNKIDSHINFAPLIEHDSEFLTIKGGKLVG